MQASHCLRSFLSLVVFYASPSAASQLPLHYAHRAQTYYSSQTIPTRLPTAEEKEKWIQNLGLHKTGYGYSVEPKNPFVLFKRQEKQPIKWGAAKISRHYMDVAVLIEHLIHHSHVFVNIIDLNASRFSLPFYSFHPISDRKNSYTRALKWYFNQLQKRNLNYDFGYKITKKHRIRQCPSHYGFFVSVYVEDDVAVRDKCLPKKACAQKKPTKTRNRCFMLIFREVLKQYGTSFESLLAIKKFGRGIGVTETEGHELLKLNLVKEQRKHQAKRQEEFSGFLPQGVMQLCANFIGNPLNFPYAGFQPKAGMEAQALFVLSRKPLRYGFFTFLDALYIHGGKFYHKAIQRGCIHGSSFIEQEIIKKGTKYKNGMEIQWDLLKADCVKTLDWRLLWLMFSHPGHKPVCEEAQRTTPMQRADQEIKAEIQRRGYVYKKGLNLLFSCYACKSNGSSRQILHFGYGTFNVVELLFKGVKCVKCKLTGHKASTLIFSDCSYHVTTILGSETSKVTKWNRDKVYEVEDKGLAKDQRSFYKDIEQDYVSMTVYCDQLTTQMS